MDIDFFRIRSASSPDVPVITDIIRESFPDSPAAQFSRAQLPETPVELLQPSGPIESGTCMCLKTIDSGA